MLNRREGMKEENKAKEWGRERKNEKKENREIAKECGREREKRKAGK